MSLLYDAIPSDSAEPRSMLASDSCWASLYAVFDKSFHLAEHFPQTKRNWISIACPFVDIYCLDGRHDHNKMQPLHSILKAASFSTTFVQACLIGVSYNQSISETLNTLSIRQQVRRSSSSVV